MPFDLVVTLIVLTLVIFALVQEKIGPEVVMLAALVVLVITGVLKMSDALSGFASESVITIGSLFVVGAGLQSTGGLNYLSRWLLGNPKPKTSFLRLFAPIAGLSAFMANTPLVAFFLPIFIQLAKRLRVSPSKLLIPLSYVSILGGTCTLIGTSTNLVVDGLMRKQGLAPMGMFELAPVGVVIIIVGLIYMATFGQRILPDRQDLLEYMEAHPREYSLEMIVGDNCSLTGQSVRAAGLRDLPGLYLYRIERAGAVITPVEPRERLQSGDLLCFSGMVATVVDLQKIRGLDPVEHRQRPQPSTNESPVESTSGLSSLDSMEGLPALVAPAPRVGRQLCEVVISPASPLVARSIKDTDFRSRYNAAIIAVHRSGQKLQHKIGQIVLQSGDTLLIDADDDFVRRWRHSPDFILVSGVDDSAPILHHRAGLALAIFLGAVVAMSIVREPALAALCGAVLMVVCRCVNGQEALRNIDISVLLLVASAMGISKALESTGAAKLLANGLLSACQGAGPVGVLAVLYVLTVLLSELLSNNATAALMGSLAIAIANQKEIDPRPLLIAVAIASSCAFATPIGYQTNLMVLNPGGYRFKDYVKVGLPLNFLCAIVAVFVIPLVWSFKLK